MKKSEIGIKIYKFMRAYGVWFRRGFIFILVAALLASVVKFSAGVIKNDRALNQEETLVEVSPLKVDSNKKYGENTFTEIAKDNRLVLYLNYSNGEFAVKDNETGITWYSNPQDRDSDSIAPIKSRLSSQLVITVYEKTTEATKTVDNFNGSVNLGGMEIEKIDNGVRIVYSFPRLGIQIPVCYTVYDGMFHATVETTNIKELWDDHYILLTVDFINFFGAGGLNDEGYMVLPDGSGSVMNFNNGKQQFNYYSMPVYGENAMLEIENNTNASVNVCMPVFGINKNGCGFLAVISSGDAEATINASVSRRSNSYNTVNSQLTYRIYSNKAIHNAAGLLDISEPLLDEEDYIVDYMFCKAGSSDYTAMANLYREYLIEKRGNKASADSAVALDVYGAVTLEQMVAGTKKDVLVPLTTYAELSDILEDLNSNGLNNLTVQYLGALKGGLHGNYISEYAAESKLGGKNGVNSLIEKAEKNGDDIYFQWDMVNLYADGGGVATGSNTVQGFFSQRAYQYNYSRNMGEMDLFSRWLLVKPSLIEKVTSKFISSLQNSNVKRISLATIGKTVFSDINGDDKCVSEQKTRRIWEQAMKSFSDNGYELMLDGANAYGYSYADIILNAPHLDNKFNMVDYNIPFLQIALRGVAAVYNESINLSDDSYVNFLKAIETGSGIKFSLFKSDVTSLINSEYSELVACNYNMWRDTVIEQGKEIAKLNELIGDSYIISHTRVSSDVTETVYSNQVCVVVNYGDESFTYKNHTIDSNGYYISSGKGE